MTFEVELAEKQKPYLFLPNRQWGLCDLVATKETDVLVYKDDLRYHFFRKDGDYTNAPSNYPNVQITRIFQPGDSVILRF